MIQITPHMRILVAADPVDFRCGIDGLVAACRKRLQAEPFRGGLFVFGNRARTGVKILIYDGQGFWIYQKRLSTLAGELETVLANCQTHGRRQVADVAEQFPEDARHVIEVLADVYKIDAACRDEALSPEQRLAFHQEHSKPLMTGLHEWITQQFDQAPGRTQFRAGRGAALLPQATKRLA